MPSKVNLPFTLQPTAVQHSLMDAAMVAREVCMQQSMGLAAMTVRPPAVRKAGL